MRLQAWALLLLLSGQYLLCMEVGMGSWAFWRRGRDMGMEVCFIVERVRMLGRPSARVMPSSSAQSIVGASSFYWVAPLWAVNVNYRGGQGGMITSEAAY
eukprot:3938-Pelagomonas_calceolata.AAC.1